MAIVFGPEIHIIIPKFGQNSHFYSSRGGGPPVLEMFLRNFFLGASLTVYVYWIWSYYRIESSHQWANNDLSWKAGHWSLFHVQIPRPHSSVVNVFDKRWFGEKVLFTTSLACRRFVLLIIGSTLVIVHLIAGGGEGNFVEELIWGRSFRDRNVS